MHLELQEVKKWLRLDLDEHEDDALIQTLIGVAKNYLYEATGRQVFGDQTEKAKLFCQFLITDWYEVRDYNNRTPMAIRKPVLTSMLMQLTYGGDNDEQFDPRVEPSVEQSGALEQAGGTLKRRKPYQHRGRPPDGRTV